jgi:stage V sporulation protein G
MVNQNMKVKQLYKLNGEGKLKAFADIVIANIFLIRGLRIINGKKGLFVDMPRTQGKDGQWYLTAYPLDAKTKSQLNDIVLQAFHDK